MNTLISDELTTERVAPLSDERFDHAISLGSNCYASAMFKRLGLKRWSGPFDWMFSTVPMVQACIETNFEQFLDRHYYEPHARDGKTEYRHTFYKTHWRTNFTHYDPFTDDGYAYMQRCVDRFQGVLRSDESKLLMFLAPIFDHERPRLTEEFQSLAKTIDKTGRNCTLIGLMATFGQTPKIVEASRSGAHCLFHYAPSSHLDGVSFGNDINDAEVDRFVMDLIRDGEVGVASDRPTTTGMS